MSGLVESVVKLCRALRDRGLLVTPSHATDAVRALQVPSLGNWFRTSAAASPGSQSGTRHNGTRRPPLSAHHSSTIQSLKALTQSRASSLSLPHRKIWPQNRG